MRGLHRTLVLAAASAVLVALGGCGSPADPARGASAAGARLAVVATTPEIADFVRTAPLRWLIGGSGMVEQ